jgi:hypothetical protein
LIKIVSLWHIHVYIIKTQISSCSLSSIAPSSHILPKCLHNVSFPLCDCDDCHL